MSRRLWDKGEPLDDRVLAYTAGEDHRLDERLLPYDVRASIAHAEMLREQGLLTPDHCARLERGLRQIEREQAEGRFRIQLEDEDVHTAIENRLGQIEDVGPETAGRIHLGRSRNDQVLAALRLYLRDAITQLAQGAEDVAGALDQVASGDQGKTPLPGYTHFQRAMPSTVALWAHGFAAELRDDAEGFEGARRRVEKNPLGSAAGYGTPGLPIDREKTRRALGFEAVHEPVTAVQLSRGKAEAGVAFEIALLLGDLGRLASDLVLFSTEEFGFVRLPAEMTTGSSIMPQKRNPDVFELVRGRTATAQAALMEILAVPAKLPSGYHRDLQLLKAPLFRAIDLALASTAILALSLPRLHFDPEKARAALTPELHAAEEANRLVVEEGIPFREAYRRVGETLRGRKS